MGEEQLSVQIEASFLEGKTQKIVTRLAVILTSKLSEHPDPAVLRALPTGIEQAFRQGTSTRESGSIVIVPGAVPKRTWICNLFWKKQKNHVFTINFLIPKESDIKQEEIRPKLVLARNLVHEYFKSVGIKSRELSTV